MHDHVDHLADEWLNVGRGRCVAGNEGLEAHQACRRIVRVQGGGAALVARIPGVEQVQRLGATHLADQDAVRTHAQGGFQQGRHGDVEGGVVLHEVLGGALDFPRVFDDEDAFAGIAGHHFVDDGVDQGGLAGAGAARDEDVAVAGHRLPQDVAMVRGHGAGSGILVQRVDCHGLLADGKGGRGDDGRQLACKARAIERQFAFQQGLAARDFLTMVAGHGLDDGLGLRRAQGTDALHPFAEPLLPQPAIGIEHDLHRARIVQRGHQKGTHVAFQLAPGPVLQCGKVFGFSHDRYTPVAFMPCRICKGYIVKNRLN